QLITKVGTPEDALRIARVLRPPDSRTPADVLPALANCQFHLAQVLRKGGKLDEARALEQRVAQEYRNEVAQYEKLASDPNRHSDFNKADYRNHLLGTLAILAETLRSQGKIAEAESVEREAADRGGAAIQNDIAWRLATDPNPKNRNGSNAVVY